MGGASVLASLPLWLRLARSLAPPTRPLPKVRRIKLAPPFSLTPCFSWVSTERLECFSRFSGFPAGKPGRVSKFGHREKSGEIAAEQRQKIAHGVSRGKRVWKWTSPGGAKEDSPRQCSFAALRLGFLAFHSHGLRRGLPSTATPWLKYFSNFEMRPTIRLSNSHI